MFVSQSTKVPNPLCMSVSTTESTPTSRMPDTAFATPAFRRMRAPQSKRGSLRIIDAVAAINYTIKRSIDRYTGCTKWNKTIHTLSATTPREGLFCYPIEPCRNWLRAAT